LVYNNNTYNGILSKYVYDSVLKNSITKNYPNTIKLMISETNIHSPTIYMRVDENMDVYVGHSKVSSVYVTKLEYIGYPFRLGVAYKNMSFKMMGNPTTWPYIKLPGTSSLGPIEFDNNVLNKMRVFPQSFAYGQPFEICLKINSRNTINGTLPVLFNIGIINTNVIDKQVFDSNEVLVSNYGIHYDIDKKVYSSNIIKTVFSNYIADYNLIDLSVDEGQITLRVDEDGDFYCGKNDVPSQIGNIPNLGFDFKIGMNMVQGDLNNTVSVSLIKISY
jgi:hypothetical protein